LNFYCLNNTFSHCKGSCLNIHPKNNWIYNKIPNDDSPLVIIDELIPSGISIHNKNKFGWICESSYIISNLIKWVKENILVIEKNYTKVFVNDKSLLELSDIFQYVPAGSNMPWVENYEIKPKTKNTSIISSKKKYTNGHIIRHNIIKNSKDIDVYGNGYNHIERKEEGMEDYMFSYCIENAKYNLYYTEKLTDAIACGSVPIYWGTDEIGEVFDQRGIIRYEDIDNYALNEELYQEMLPYVRLNLQILKNQKCSDDIVQEKIMEMNDE